MAGDAIILIPGIKGTNLVDTNRASHDTIWSGVQSAFESIEDLTLTNRYEGRYFDEDRKVIIKPGEIESLAYGEFIRDLRTDKPVYIFHYDWRMSAVESGRKLADFLNYLIDKSHASNGPTYKSFDFVTHSLGNFVLRAFINEYELDLINKVVFTVPPFKGALDIVTAVLVGQGFLGHTKDKIRKLIRTMPGALELLPTYKGSAEFTSGNVQFSFLNHSHWQHNITCTDNGVSKAKKALAEKFIGALEIAKKTVNTGLYDLTKLPKSVRKKMLVIVRHGSNTMQSVDIEPRSIVGDPGNFIHLADARHSEHGDGTVPHASSCCYWNDIMTLAIKDDWFQEAARMLNPLKDRHAFVLNDERVQRLITRFFNNTAFKPRSPGGQVKVVKGLNPKDSKPNLGWEAMW